MKCAIEDRTSPNYLKLKLLGGCFTIIYKFCDISFILSKRKVACKSEYDQFRKSRLSRVPNDGATKYLPDNQLYITKQGCQRSGVRGFLQATGYYERGPQLLSKENRRKIDLKEIPSCLILRLLIVP